MLAALPLLGLFVLAVLPPVGILQTMGPALNSGNTVMFFLQVQVFYKNTYDSIF